MTLTQPLHNLYPPTVWCFCDRSMEFPGEIEQVFITAERILTSLTVV